MPDVNCRKTVFSRYIFIVICLFSGISMEFYQVIKPEVTQYFNVQVSQTQLSFIMFLIGLGVMQLFFGFLIRWFTRQQLTYLLLSLFSLTSFLSAMAPSVSFIQWMRFLQACSTGGCMLVAFSTLRENLSYDLVGRNIALAGIFIGISAGVSPLFGALIATAFGWRVVFIVLGMMGLISCFFIKNVKSSINKCTDRYSFDKIFKSYYQLIKSREYMLLCLPPAFSFTSFFIFLLLTPYIFILKYHYSKELYGALFSINAVGYFLGSYVANNKKEIFAGLDFLSLSIVVFIISGFGFLVVTFLSNLNFGIWLYFLFMSLGSFSNALINPSCMSLSSYILDVDPFFSISFFQFMKYFVSVLMGLILLFFSTTIQVLSYFYLLIVLLFILSAFLARRISFSSCDQG